MITAMDIMDVLNIVMRWTHIASMTVLLGGLLFLWIGFTESDGPASDRAARGYRSLFFAAMFGVLLSGIYNYIRVVSGAALKPAYHAVFGIKFLLVLHVLAAGIFAMKTPNPKRRRQAAGAAITGFIILALSAVLRSMRM